jgi:signal transduction histidine kinase
LLKQSIWEDLMALYVRRKIAFVFALAAGAALFAATASAQMMAHQGTAADAKAMLDKTVAAIKADKAKTLDEINKGENGFLQGDIYPFCFNLSDGILIAVANPNAKGNLGKDIRSNKDATGDAYGERLYAAAQKGSGEVSYMFPKAGADKTPVAKVSFVASAAGLGCGVGYYK